MRSGTVVMQGESYEAAAAVRRQVRSLAEPVVFAPTDESAAGLAELVADLRGKGANVLVAEPGRRQTGRLPALSPGHPDADAICLIQSFYAFLIALAAQRGTNLDRPRHLQKVTRTP